LPQVCRGDVEVQVNVECEEHYSQNASPKVECTLESFVVAAMWEEAVGNCLQSSVAAIRNQHPYVINYVSAKSGKIFNFRKKNFF